jgi:hypothetical protein
MVSSSNNTTISINAMNSTYYHPPFVPRPQRGRVFLGKWLTAFPPTPSKRGLASSCGNTFHQYKKTLFLCQCPRTQAIHPLCEDKSPTSQDYFMLDCASRLLACPSRGEGTTIGGREAIAIKKVHFLTLYGISRAPFVLAERGTGVYVWTHPIGWQDCLCPEGPSLGGLVTSCKGGDAMITLSPHCTLTRPSYARWGISVKIFKKDNCRRSYYTFCLL